MRQDLLNNLLQLGIEKTEITRKLTLGGKTAPYPVYRIPLEYLYYNDQNDRIATWISKYIVEHQGAHLDINSPDYNDVVQKFIEESNREAIKKTQENIELFDQREPGVVLSDGRIIDGNRRFTCLRNLAKTKSRFGYFEAVILQHSLETNEKQIKMLELSIQHGEESKVDYDPIDRLVGIYQDVVERKLLTEQEYKESTNAPSLQDVKKQIEIAKLMVEFLEYIDAPKQYYIAREMSLNGPLVELHAILKKAKDRDTAERLKNSAFTNFLMAPSGDMTRFIRKIKTIAPSRHLEEFLDEQEEIAEKVLDAFPVDDKVNITFINEKLRSNEGIKQQLSHSLEKASTRVANEKSRNMPEQLAERAATTLKDINTDVVNRLATAQRQAFLDRLHEIREILEELEEAVQ